ncbi:MAG: copper resistance protein CopC [Actinobacteria bacterium]|nr:copper resistance protein CopC [Actinomycetota bacterium]
MKARGMLRFTLSILFAVQLSINPASAHSKLVNSIPSSNQVVNSHIHSVTLNFNEKILVLENETPNKIQVIQISSGKSTLGKLTVAKSQAKLRFSNSLDKGKYKVKYRVVSEDGHPVQGSYFFTVK